MHFVLLVLLLSEQNLVLEYERRERVVGQQLSERKTRAQKHAMALYRLTKNGLGPWLVEPFGDLVARERALRRLVDRDLVELRLYNEERQRLATLRAGISATSHAKAELSSVGLRLISPTGSRQVIGPFGYYQEGSLRLFRRGVLLASSAGGRVVAPISGRVVYTGPLPDLGEVVILSPEENLFVVVAFLRDLAVETGSAVDPGTPLGIATRGSVLLEVRQGAVPLDPEPFLRHALR